MLQNLRNNIKGLTAWILIGLISIPFVLFGVDSLFVSGGSVEKVAQVDGEKITKLQLDQAIQMRKQQLINRFGDIDPSLLDDNLLRGMVLEGLIQQKVIEQVARDNAMDVSVATAYKLIRETPDFQVNGNFDPERYEYTIRRFGYTPTAHVNQVRDDLVRSQFNLGIAVSSMVTPTEMERLANIVNEQRDYYYLTIPGDSFGEEISVNESEIQSFYENNNEQYIADEMVEIEYLDLHVNDFLDRAKVDENMLQEAYKIHIETLQATQTKQISHILLAEDDMELALSLKEQLDSGADFADLAKQYSIDSGSATQGGQLGYVVEGVLPEKMEEAIAELTVGEVSAPVVSEAGIHLIKLTADSVTETPSFESLRDELMQTVKAQLAKELFAEALVTMADSAYNASSLSETAQLVDHELQRDEVSRSGGEGIAAIPAVINAAFSEEVLLQGYPSEVLEIGEDRAIVLRVLEHHEQALRPLDEVREDIKIALINQKREQQLRALGQKVIDQVQQGESLESVAKNNGYAWQVSLAVKRIGGNVDAEIRDYAFSLQQPGQTPSVNGFVNSKGDFVVVNLTRITAGNLVELDPDQRQAMRSSLRATIAEQELTSLSQLLVDTAKVKIN